MDRERWQRLKSILDDALERKGSEREAFVDECCARHPEFAAELRSLLSAADGPVGDVTATEISAGAHVSFDPTTKLPERIGPYRVVSKLGEGGMGMVYEAEQTNPKRRVAVKIVRGGEFVDDKRVKLFQREADTLARLKHPSIGAIYESGHTEDGQHFFAMELVRGETLDDYIGKRASVVTVDELRFRLSLFREIADAVHYAHQRGVIHRDLKPSNIVVTEETTPGDDTKTAMRWGAHLPEVKILDFGLARITEGDTAAATMATEVGVIKGTLAYMSPEQARGIPEDIDLRSDVYALGVILYEMLSGRRPYELTSKSLAESLRAICDEPPTPLGQSWQGTKRLDIDIETIVGRALDKDADRRYPSAAALSEDVSRYLTSQPILARPPSTIYQLSKFAKRNKALVGGVAATFVALVSGVVVSATLGLREAEQRREAEAARNDLQTVVDFQSGMLRQVDPREMGAAVIEDIRERAESVMRETGMDETAIEAEIVRFDDSLTRINSTDVALRVLDDDVLDRAAQTIDERFGDQPLIEARLRASLGATYFDLGLFEKGEFHTARALEIRREELGPEHRDTLAVYLLLSFIHEQQGRLEESEQAAREIYAAARRLYGEEDEFTLQALTRLAIALDVQEQLDEALEAYTTSYEVMRKRYGDDHNLTIWSLHNIGSIHRRAGRPDQGEPMLEEALERFRRTRGDEHFDTLWAMESLTFLYQAQGRLDEAERLCLEALGHRRRLLGDEHNKTLVSADTLAGIYRDQGRLDEADSLFVDTLKKRRRILGDDHWLTRWSIYGLAETRARQDRYEEAAALYEELLGVGGWAGGVRNFLELQVSLSLGATYRKMGRSGEAEKLLQRALDGYLESASNYRLDIARAHAELGMLKAARGENAAAIEHLRRVVEAGDEAMALETLHDPALDDLRGDPAFETLVAGAGGI